MTRRILSTLAAAAAALMIVPPAGAAGVEECRRFGAEWKVCYWLLEPNPSGGNLYHFEICEGATCIVVEEVSILRDGAEASDRSAGEPITVGTESCYVTIEGWPPPPITIDLSEPPFVHVGYGPGPNASVHCPLRPPA